MVVADTDITDPSVFNDKCDDEKQRYGQVNEQVMMCVVWHIYFMSACYTF
jgi:hypothetical protein